jgi:TonB family protein
MPKYYVQSAIPVVNSSENQGLRRHVPGDVPEGFLRGVVGPSQLFRRKHAPAKDIHDPAVDAGSVDAAVTGPARNPPHKEPQMKKRCYLASLALLVAATAAAGAESIALASVSRSTTASHASTEQDLAALTALGTYDASTRKALEAVARYPNRAEARNARLQGKVIVEFQIDRQGALQEAEVVETSRSRLLDATALASVRLARYQALPADLLPGETGRRYQMTFDYRFAPRD